MAAVAGLVFDERVISGVLDSNLDDTVDALDAAIAAGLIREVDTGRFVFAHALVRHTVLDDLSRTRLARLHWLIAEQLERHHPSRLGEIAHHYAFGRQIGDDATVARTSLAAGEDALNVSRSTRRPATCGRPSPPSTGCRPTLICATSSLPPSVNALIAARRAR